MEKPAQDRAIEVEAGAFLSEAIRLLARRAPAPAPPPLARGRLYLAYIRHLLAFDHDGDGQIRDATGETGTVLKAFLILPHLRALGVTDLVLLPMTPSSTSHRKGRLGSPYAVRAPRGLDPMYADPVFPDAAPEELFRLFVAAAHRQGLRVHFDVIPRTAARDADDLLDHPEWFYWIDRAAAADFAAPRFPEIPVQNAAPEPEWLDRIYASSAARRHLAAFRPDPGRVEGWDRFERAARANGMSGETLLEEIATHFGVVVPPAFSDCVNDPQPPWSDVTYLRLHHDPPVAAAPFLEPGQAPYFLQDVAKASRFPGASPIEPLWDRLARTLPDFIRDFDIDGVRIDMGHALPDALEERIRAAARDAKPGFVLLAEEFSIREAGRFAENGYDAMIGDAWWRLPRAAERPEEFAEWAGGLAELPIPIWGTAETPDTPRAAARPGGADFARWSAHVAAFLPGAVPTISGGAEFGETAPLNTGLDFSPAEAAAHEGHLAFFDPVGPDWTRAGAAKVLAETTAFLARTRGLPPPVLEPAPPGRYVARRGGLRLCAAVEGWRAAASEVGSEE